MNAMRESWTDERLDDLNGTVDELSGRVDVLTVRVDELSGRVDVLTVRVDELSGRVERGFEQAHRELRDHRAETAAEFKALRTETAAEFRAVGAEFKAVRAEMKAGFDDIHRLMLQISVIMGAALIGVIATLTGVMVTQL